MALTSHSPSHTRKQPHAHAVLCARGYQQAATQKHKFLQNWPPLVTTPLSQPPKGDRAGAAAACFTGVAHRQVPQEAAPPRNSVMVGHRLQKSPFEPLRSDASRGLQESAREGTGSVKFYSSPGKAFAHLTT